MKLTLLYTKIPLSQNETNGDTVTLNLLLKKCYLVKNGVNKILVPFCLYIYLA